jgi:uncharacterized membrane protein
MGCKEIKMTILMKIIIFMAYFYLYSFMGWILESVYKTILERKIVNSGFLFGPICPIYGLGALIMYIFLSGYNSNPLHVFIIGFVVLSIWEYIVAWGIEKIFNEKYWDYSEKKFNINGRVCLLNSVFWGVLGVIFIYVIHPIVSLQIKKINSMILIIAIIVLTLLMITDMIISIIRLNSISKHLQDIQKIGSEIKQKLDRLKSDKNIKESTQEAIQLLINDLKTQEGILKIKLLKETVRIRKAFPSMKSEKFKQISKYIRK